MSKYTDYLNTHPDIDYKDFIKVCAWNAKQLASYVPDALAPVEEEIPLDITELNEQLDIAMDNLQELEALSAEEQVNLRDTAFDEVENAHWNKINELEKLITVYGTILSDLCRWNPTNNEIKALKSFAIKELTTNMPDLSKHAASPVEPTVNSYIDSLRKKYNNIITSLTKQITTESKNNNTANDYINLLLSELNLAQDDDLPENGIEENRIII